MTNSDICDDAFVIGSGDYLRDRGYAEPGEARAKFFLANQIAVAIQELKLSQTSAAENVGLKQPDVSRIVNGNVRDYSVWRLLKVLRDLGWDVSIEVERRTDGQGRIYAVDRSGDSEVLALA